MKLASHLKRSRHGVYYFRITIPKRLRPLFGGRTELKHSLGTKNPSVAKRQAYMLSARANQLFHEAKQTMPYDPKKLNVNDPSTWPKKDENLPGLKARMGNVELESEPGNRADLLALHETIQKFGQFHSIDLIEPIAPHARTAPREYSRRLSDAIEYVMLLVKKDPHREKTVLEKQSIYERFQAWAKNPYLTDITSEHLTDYMRYLLFDAPRKNGDKGLSKSTTKKHLSFLHGFFMQLQRLNFFPKTTSVPTQGISPYAKGEFTKLRGKNAYLPFEPKELSLIFNPDTLRSLKKPHEYWTPLIGLYTGARLDEIAQLRLKDIEKKDNIWCYSITDDGIETTTKNTSSVRTIPIHPSLIDLGLMDYVEDVRSVAPEGRLFPYLLESVNGYADIPSESFARYWKSIIKSTMTLSPSTAGSQRSAIPPRAKNRKTFHSFRSTLIQLIENNTGDKARKYYVGHALESDHDLIYGNKTPTPSSLMDLVVDHIKFPEVDDKIQQLRHPKQHFLDSLKSEMARRERERKNAEARKARGVPPLRSNKRSS